LSLASQEPFKKPTEALTQTVIKGTVDVEKEIAELRKIAERETHGRGGNGDNREDYR